MGVLRESGGSYPLEILDQQNGSMSRQIEVAGERTVFSFRIRLNRFTILRVVGAHKDQVLVTGGMKWRD